MNEFAFSYVFEGREKTAPVYPQDCGKVVDIFWAFYKVFHSPKPKQFWLFGSYPGFPPHYGYSC